MVEKRRARGCGRRCVKCWTNKVCHNNRPADPTLVCPDVKPVANPVDTMHDLAPAGAIFPQIKSGRKDVVWICWQSGHRKHRRRRLTSEEVERVLPLRPTPR